MRRTKAGFKSGNMVNTPEGEQGFWPSYTDMMSSLALILFFLMLIAYLQNIITGNHLKSTEDNLKNTEATLSATLKQIDDAKAELSALSLDLDEAKNSIVLKESELEESASLLLDQQAKLDEQQQYIALTTNELQKLRSQMREIAYLRADVVNQIKNSIESTLGNTSKVYINDNGSIALEAGLLFDSNSAEIKRDGRPFLDNIAVALSKFLSENENVKYVDSIVIAGHTDNKGGQERNRILSTERANSVLNYLLSSSSALSGYDTYFSAVGYGMNRPVADNNTEEGRSQNRRIEISIAVKDDAMTNVVNSYLDTEMPGIDVNVNKVP